MPEIRWFLAAICALFYLICMTISVASSVRWLRKRKSGSGLWFVGSIAAFVGALLAPIGTPTQRLPFAFLPLAFEALLFAGLWTVNRFVTEKDGDAAR